jgi:4-diphosphocytidyl-2-C-methyl-D-erythritol kinase
MLEVIPATDDRFRLEISGDEPDCDAEHNLCTRAFRLMEREFAIGQVHMYLHKRIPSGGGTGRRLIRCGLRPENA